MARGSRTPPARKIASAKRHKSGSFASSGVAACARPFLSGAAGAAWPSLHRSLIGDRLRTAARPGLAPAGQPCASGPPLPRLKAAGAYGTAARRRRAPARPRLAEPGSQAPLIGAQRRRCERARLEALRQAAAELALACSAYGCGGSGRGGCQQGRQNRERVPDLTGTDRGVS